MASPEKVLIFLLGSLGDSIVAIPALRVVRHNFPDAELVVLHESGLGLVEPPQVLPDDLVDRYLSYERRKYGPLSSLRLLRRLRLERFDAAVYLVFSERPARSVQRDRMFFRAAGIGRLFGFHSFGRRALYPLDAKGRPAKVPSEAERKISRLEADGLLVNKGSLQLPWLSPKSSEIETGVSFLNQHAHQQLILAVAPGCKTKANQWPFDNFIHLIEQVRNQVPCAVVIVGGATEAGVGNAICRDLGGCLNAAEKFTVRETAALLSQCDAYVGLDTGTTHLAAAVGAPVVAIYGQRNNPGQWFPHATALKMVQNHVRCAGCRAQVCTVAGHPCMTGIKFEEAAAAVVQMLEMVILEKQRHQTAGAA
jgi:heptosyltransferase-3